MTEFSGVTGLAVVELAVVDNAHTEAPADVYENHIPVSLLAEGHIFAVCHSPRVVFYVDLNVELFLEYAFERNVVAHEVGEAVTLFRVHAAGKAHAYSQHLYPRNTAFRHLILHHAAYRAEGHFACLEDEFYVLDELDDFTFEIAYGNVKMVSGNVHAHEIASLRLEAVNTWAPTAGSAYLALVLKEIVFDQLSDQLGYRRNADAEGMAEIGYAVILVDYAEPEDFTLYAGILAAGIAQKSWCHNNIG